MWIILAFLSAVFAALVTIFAKIGLTSIDSTLATTVRATFMVLALVLTSFFLGKLTQINQINGRDWLFIILSGLAGAASWIFYFAALKMGPAGKIAVIDRLSLVFIVVLAAIFLGEKFSLKSVFGVVMMVVGAILVVWV